MQSPFLTPPLERFSYVCWKELEYTTQVNSAFRARWLASSEVIRKVLFTSEQPKKNKMASRQIKSLLNKLSYSLVR